jgi:transcriptional regulator with XRE-family HTH domain
MTEGRILTLADWRVRLRSRIAELGINQRDADELAGLSEGHTAKILCGLRNPSLETAMRLEAALWPLEG